MPRRNLLVITSHDLGAHLNSHGQQTVLSPNLDRLAAEGMMFANHFAAAPTCSPSRACLWTGRYPHSTGMLGLCHEWSLHDDERHLAQHFRAAGRQTALFGDQHTHLAGGKRLGYDFEQPGKARINIAAEESAGFFLDYLRTLPQDAPPFFAQIGFHEPHRPFDIHDTKPCSERGVAVPPPLPDTPAMRADFAAYQGSIKRLDDAIGMILDGLDASPHADHTTVVFTVDHGIPFPRAKMTLYDPGLRVALIVREPRWNACGGRRVTAMTSHVDFAPTILDGFGLTSDPQPEIHGHSMLPLLTGKSNVGREEIFATQTYHGDNDYLPMRGIRTSRHKYIVNFEKNPTYDLGHGAPDPAVFELYDLLEDPLELDNLAGQPEHAAVAADLDQRLRAWMRQTKDPICNGVPTTRHYRNAATPFLHPNNTQG